MTKANKIQYSRTNIGGGNLILILLFTSEVSVLILVGKGVLHEISLFQANRKYLLVVKNIGLDFFGSDDSFKDRFRFELIFSVG